jgi:hypothetical protein
VDIKQKKRNGMIFEVIVSVFLIISFYGMLSHTGTDSRFYLWRILKTKNDQVVYTKKRTLSRASRSFNVSSELWINYISCRIYLKPDRYLEWRLFEDGEFFDKGRLTTGIHMWDRSNETGGSCLGIWPNNYINTWLIRRYTDESFIMAKLGGIWADD